MASAEAEAAPKLESAAITACRALYTLKPAQMLKNKNKNTKQNKREKSGIGKKKKENLSLVANEYVKLNVQCLAVNLHTTATSVLKAFPPS